MLENLTLDSNSELRGILDLLNTMSTVGESPASGDLLNNGSTLDPIGLDFRGEELSLGDSLVQDLFESEKLSGQLDRTLTERFQRGGDYGFKFPYESPPPPDPNDEPDAWFTYDDAKSVVGIIAGFF